MRRQEAAIELHPLNHLDGRLTTTPLFDGDNAILAHLQERLSQHTTYRRIIITSNRCDLLNLLLALHVNRLGHLLDLGHHLGNRSIDATRQGHRVTTRGNHLQAFTENRLRQHGGRGRAITRHVIRLAGSLFNQLDGQVFVRIIQLDVLSDRDPVLGDLGRTPTLIQNRVTAPWPQRATHGLGQLAHTCQQRGPRLVVKYHLFRHVKIPPQKHLEWSTLSPDPTTAPDQT